MTAIIHLTTGESVSIEKLVKVIVNSGGGLGQKSILPNDVAALEIFDSSKCAFVGETGTLVFASGVIKYVEFTKE